MSKRKAKVRIPPGPPRFTSWFVLDRTTKAAEEQGVSSPFQPTGDRFLVDGVPCTNVKYIDGGLVELTAQQAFATLGRSLLGSDKGKGGKAPKYAKAIMAETERILRKARNLKSMDVFNLFPDSRKPKTLTLDDGEYTIYRDGDTLIQIDPRGKERQLGQEGFLNRYIPKARSNTK